MTRSMPFSQTAKYRRGLPIWAQRCSAARWPISQCSWSKKPRSGPTWSSSRARGPSDPRDCRFDMHKFRRSGLRNTRYRMLEDPVRHHLAALHKPRLVWAVIRDGIVQRTDIVPHHQVALAPLMFVAVSRLQLVGEQEGQDLVTFRGVHIVDPHRVARIGIQYLAARDRMGEKDRMRDRRLRRPPTESPTLNRSMAIISVSLRSIGPLNWRRPR